MSKNDILDNIEVKYKGNNDFPYKNVVENIIKYVLKNI